MGVFGKRAPRHLIPISPDNAASNDWVILLEAGTIVGPSPDRLRVAKSTLEKKIVKRYGIYLNFTSTTLTKRLCLCKERRSEN
jgi:hypothetical protein